MIKIKRMLNKYREIFSDRVLCKPMISEDDSTAGNKEQNGFLRLISGASFAFRALFCIFIAFTLLTLIFIDKGLNVYYIPNGLEASNKLLILASLALFITVICAAYLLQRIKSGKKFKRKLSEKQFYLIIALAFAAVYLLQLFISNRIYLKTEWDVIAITNAAEKIANGEADGVPAWYFNQYPNNMMITYTLVFLYRVGKVFFSADPYKAVLLFVSFVVCVSVFLATLCIYRMTGSRKLTACGMIIGVLLIAINPWIVIPYTDSIPMIFPVLAVFCYLYVKNKYLRYSLLTFICILGYYYKPTIIILLIALVILKLFSLMEKLLRKRFFIMQCACMLLCVVISAGCAFGVDRVVTSLNKTELDANKQMTMTHYLMMGLNVKNEGAYSLEDVNYSNSFPDVESRQKANLDVAKSRFKEMGLKGYVKLLIKKNISTYNDATFGWGREGKFYYEVPEDNRSSTKVLRSFYYTNEQGTNHQAFATAEQILWLFILMCICFCILPLKTKGGAENLLTLTLLGVSMFLLIFECRARYLFVFSPLFVILAAAGLYKAYLFAEKCLFTKE